MNIEKAFWRTDEDRVHLNMPLSKVDVDKRTVSGFASLDNADTQGDIVLKEANNRAFARFRGNIREMHQPIAVGRMIDFREDSFYDDATQKFYNGIWVNAYVSEGAEDTWKKVLDGTLQGFSIGGNIIDAETQFVKDAGRSIRFVKDYELYELSLVDSPANPLANIFSIEKSSSGMMIMKGMIADTRTENVFWCNEDGIAKNSSDDSTNCPACGQKMENIGWYELGQNDNPSEKMAGVITKFKSSNTTGSSLKTTLIKGGLTLDKELTEKLNESITKQVDPATNQGGVDVAEETTTVVEAAATNEVVEAPLTEENVVNEVPVTEEVETVGTEEAANVSEVEDEEGPDFEKMLGDIHNAIKKGSTATAEAIETVKGSVEEVRKNIEAQMKELVDKHKELVDKHDELSKRFDGLNEKTADVEKRIDGVISGSAVQKSSRLGGHEEKIEKSRWQGTFLGTNDI